MNFASMQIRNAYGSTEGSTRLMCTLLGEDGSAPVFLRNGTDIVADTTGIGRDGILSAGCSRLGLQCLAESSTLCVEQERSLSLPQAKYSYS